MPTSYDNRNWDRNQKNNLDGTNAIIKGFGIHGWSFTISKGPQASIDERSAFNHELSFQAPKYLYPQSSIKANHPETGLSLGFYARPALHSVDKSGSEAKRIEYALENNKFNLQLEMHNNDNQNVKLPKKPFDWTYTTTYNGSSTKLFNGKNLNPHHEIHSNKILQNYDYTHKVISNSCILFEDDLDGCGYCSLAVNLAITENSFRILQRQFIRVNEVLFRMFDTEISHEFGTNYLDRHSIGWEAKWMDVFYRLPSMYQNTTEKSMEYQDKVQEILDTLSPKISNKISGKTNDDNVRPSSMMRSISTDSILSSSNLTSTDMEVESSNGSNKLSPSIFAARVILSRHNSGNSKNHSSRRNSNKFIRRKRNQQPPGALKLLAKSISSQNLQSSCVSPLSSGLLTPNNQLGAGTGWNGNGYWFDCINLNNVSKLNNKYTLPDQLPPPPPVNDDEDYDFDSFDDDYFEMDDWEYERRKSYHMKFYNDSSSHSSDDDDEYYKYHNNNRNLNMAQQLTKRLEKLCKRYPDRRCDCDNI